MAPLRIISTKETKIAPRSTLQFKVGPPFELVRDYCPVVESHTGRTLDLRIIPRIDRGFDHIDEEWYQRLKRQIVIWILLKSSFDLLVEDSSVESRLRVQYFAIKIKAKNDDDTEINLVQQYSETRQRSSILSFSMSVGAFPFAKTSNHKRSFKCSKYH
ncbi:CNT_collapsed_G0023990.mRNA.1.CDS.1 [Saccharomyces cerevisiae]|nr:CNT_collapsed_G0023990.mRNA.1.CDS.1 [Saccharomyces cerevisiae]